MRARRPGTATPSLTTKMTTMTRPQRRRPRPTAARPRQPRRPLPAAMAARARLARGRRARRQLPRRAAARRLQAAMPAKEARGRPPRPRPPSASRPRCLLFLSGTLWFRPEFSQPPCCCVIQCRAALTTRTYNPHLTASARRCQATEHSATGVSTHSIALTLRALWPEVLFTCAMRKIAARR